MSRCGSRASNCERMPSSAVQLWAAKSSWLRRHLRLLLAFPLCLTRQYPVAGRLRARYAVLSPLTPFSSQGSSIGVTATPMAIEVYDAHAGHHQTFVKKAKQSRNYHEIATRIYPFCTDQCCTLSPSSAPRGDRVFSEVASYLLRRLLGPTISVPNSRPITTAQMQFAGKRRAAVDYCTFAR